MMFTSRTKRNYKTPAVLAVVMLLCIIFGAAVWPAPPEESSGQTMHHDVPSEPENYSMNPDSSVSQAEPGITPAQNPSLWEAADGALDSDQLPDTTSAENADPLKNNSNISTETDSYYLVKKAGGQIAVFYCDGKGTTLQLETTEILYELLAPEDQLLFDAGVRLRSQEELSVLLQDFEG